MMCNAGPILALELSAGTGSLALLDPGGAILAERRWPEGRRGNPELWTALSDLLAGLDGGASALARIAVGRGPGRYTGLRTALAVGQALALPFGTPVHAVDSGEALALAILDGPGTQAARVAIAGDARRDQCWIGFFRNAAGWPEPEGAWQLCPVGAPLLTLPPGTVGASAEWTRLAPLLAGGARGDWIRDDRAPDAVAVGRLALHAVATGRAPAPLSPVYLHPAVQPVPGDPDPPGRPTASQQGLKQRPVGGKSVRSGVGTAV